MLKALKGNLISTETPERFTIIPNGYLVYEDGKVIGTYCVLPEGMKGCEVKDYGDCLILPALVDLHVHAPQYAFRGIGMDMQLLDWLNTYTFPAEARFADPDYARGIYSSFARELLRCGTTRAVVFGTIHQRANQILLEELNKQGIQGYVGKVNMDRNSPDSLIEQTEDSIRETVEWIQYTRSQYRTLKPIITPRFVPSCSDRLLKELGKLAEQYSLPVQSHLSENQSEIAWVKELQPDSRHYCDAYNRFNLFGGGSLSCVMAHCVHLSEEEIELMAVNGVTAAHCPDSNNNLASGISPVRKLLNHGVKVGLGSDIAGGFRLSVFQVMASAVQMSKIRWLLQGDGDTEKPLSVSEAFYLGTSGGAQFFGDKPGFAEGNAMHVLVVDDSSLGTVRDKTLEERIQRVIHISDDRNLIARYIDGVERVAEG